MEAVDKLPAGVSYEANRRIKKYKAKIRINGKLQHLGYFRTAEEAHKAFSIAKKQAEIHEGFNKPKEQSGTK